MQPEFQPQEVNKVPLVIEKQKEVIPPNPDNSVNFLDAQEEIAKNQRIEERKIDDLNKISLKLREIRQKMHALHEAEKNLPNHEENVKNLIDHFKHN